MDAGLRGYSVGDAQVSKKHCGFVVNKGEATAADVLTLIKDVQETVLKQFGVKLEPEVKMNSSEICNSDGHVRCRKKHSNENDGGYGIFLYRQSAYTAIR